MFRLGCAGLIGSLVLMYIGFQEYKLATHANDEPEEMTLVELVKRGPEGNPHIRLTDFTVGDEFVSEERKRGGWSKVWVPLVPLEEVDARNPEVKILLYSKSVSDAEELQQLIMEEKLEGMVTNQIESLGSSERKLLQESYPRANFDTCIIFEPGRKPSGLLQVGLWVGGGLALFVACFFLLAKRSRA